MRVICKKGVARVLEKFKSQPANSPLHVLLALQGKLSSVGRGHNKRGLVDLRQHRRTVMSHPSVKQRNGGIRRGVHRLGGDALQVFLGLRLLIHLSNELRRRSRAIFLQIPPEIEIPLHEIRVALKDNCLSVCKSFNRKSKVRWTFLALAGPFRTPASVVPPCTSP